MKFLSSLIKKDLQNKICLLRVDLNVQELETRQNIHPRVSAILPTIEFLIGNGAKVVILSHRGRPKPAERANSEFSLKPLAAILSKLLKKTVNFVDFQKLDDFGELKSKIQDSSPGSIFLLENLRFWPEEERNNPKFAKKLAFLGDFYVNDAFAVSHRKNASVAAITLFLPSYAGLLLEKEIKNLSAVIKNPKRPMAVILGGAKISDKIGVIKNLYSKADYFLLGGALANTVFAAQGIPVGDSLYEKKIDAKKIMRQFGKKIFLPTDVIVEKRKILDIGQLSVKKYKEIIGKSKTVVFNGPMGYIEKPKFAKATKEIIAALLKSRSRIIIGGGETTSLFAPYPKPHTLNPYLFISTGGGAMLEYLSGKKLPGLEALK
ncbi:phosphoglycerate kinase [Candidatus Wolfebacteria bacterium]|nr:phosphoglycerate kinase [Candidatus Wolfebacteria bacterium]